MTTDKSDLILGNEGLVNARGWILGIGNKSIQVEPRLVVGTTPGR